MQVISEGGNLKISNVAISAAPRGITPEQGCNSITLQARNGTAFRIYEVTDNALGDYFSVKANAVPFKINVSAIRADRAVIFVRTESGTDTLEVLNIV